jgi:arylsulfatase A
MKSSAFAITMGLLLAFGCRADLALAADLPHVLVILVDDLGYGDLGCFNSESQIPTPNIDRLAAQGMRFTDAHASGPLCHLSRYGLMTGRYPFRAPCGAWSRQPVIDEGEATIASLLKQKGYATAMVGKWHLGFDEPGYDQPYRGGPVDRGFDSFFGIRASTDIPPYYYIRNDRVVMAPTLDIKARQTEGWSPIQGEFWRAGKISPDLKLEEVLPRLAQEAVQVIESHSKQSSEQPLFLYLALPAPHTPWLPAAEFVGRTPIPLYGDFTFMVDAMVGRVLAALDQSGMADNTLVLVTSDNGPVWYEEDVTRYQHDASGGWRGMKADAWEAGHRMPLIIRWPNHVRTDSVNEDLVSFVDVFATLAELTDQPLEGKAGPDSFSFLSSLLEKPTATQPQRTSLALASGNGTMTLRKGPWKLIQGLGSGGFSKPSKIKPEQGGPAGQLYHLVEDPEESTNLYLQHPDRVQAMLNELRVIQGATASRLIP